jgi:sulfotransferase
MVLSFVALSGLPRTGSTLLSAILSQNPEIHAEGNSAVCQLMWDMQQSVVNSEQIKASSKNLLDALVKPIPHTYYANITKPIVVDKCRSWTLPANMEILNRYFDNTPKVIVLVRPLVEIVASFISLRKKNNWINPEEGLLDDGSEPIMRSLAGVEWARKNNNGEFLFVTYDELVDDTQVSLDRIYEHCGWRSFEHNLDNIINEYQEIDPVYGLVDLHNVRPQISRQTVDIDLSDELIEKCNRLDNWSMYGTFR